MSIKQRKYYLVPGPSNLDERVLQTPLVNGVSSDLEPVQFFDEQYVKACKSVETLLCAPPTSSAVIMCGEGMLALWAGLKNTITKNTRVLSIGCGIYGVGIGGMARDCGAQVRIVGDVDGVDNDDAKAEIFSKGVTDEILEEVRKVSDDFKPEIITCVHVDTPSGVRSPLKRIGEIARRHNALLYADTVASAFGESLNLTETNVDLALIGSQKCLSLQSNLCAMVISERAWKRIEEVKYIGYEALMPWKNVRETKLAPYTLDFTNFVQLNAVLGGLAEESMIAVIDRHEKCMQFTRSKLQELGFRLFVAEESRAARTCTSAWLPENCSFDRFQQRCRNVGLEVGGSYGVLSDRIFRIGHMGSQARIEYLRECLEQLKTVLSDL